MAVIIGSARHDERGKYIGGAAGDQTGDEVSTQAWYQHAKGWILLRAKDKKCREKIAENMEAACNNSNIGYDQGQNTTLYDAAKSVGFDCSKVTVKCETDCARLVRVCVLYAGISVDDFYTGNEKETLQQTGQFSTYTGDKYCKSSDYLLRGDILVTRTKGHTVVVLSNGAKAAVHTTLSRGMKGEEVSELQRTLNRMAVKDAAGRALEVDGSFGSKTKAAVTNFQEENGLTGSGICNQRTWAKIDDQLLTCGKKVMATTQLNCRMGPSSAYAKIKVLPAKDDKAKTIAERTWTKLRESNGWYYLAEPEGWASGKYLTYV